MAEQKTLPTGASVSEFLDSVEPPGRRADGFDVGPRADAEQQFLVERDDAVFVVADLLRIEAHRDQLKKKN